MDRPMCRTCGTTESLLRCAKCKTVFYCSTAHQHIDWPNHKQLCRYLAKQRLRLQQQQQNNNRLSQMSINTVGGGGGGGISIGGVDTADYNNWGGLFGTESMDVTDGGGGGGGRDDVVVNGGGVGGSFGHITAGDANILAGVDTMSLVLGTSEAEIMNSRAEIVLQSQHSNALFNNTLTSGVGVGVVGGGGGGGGGVGNNIGVVSGGGGGSDNSLSYRVGRGDENYYQHHNMGGNTNERNEELCRNIINDMNTYGLSVVDDFLGMEKGLSILNEVHGMYAAGVFKDGQLVSSNQMAGQDLRTIRGDKITWVTGVEQGCANVGYLINQIDAVITRANTMKNNGKLGNYTIRERTKAMVACYPGSGAHYVMHVDNPNKDGRVITAIYYLNVNWDTMRSGGVLRIFPEHGGSIAEIEPKFDRLIFFWSDKRNPHEVQPAHRTRYAITVWYFDADEREAALNRCKQFRNKTNSTTTTSTSTNAKNKSTTTNTQNNSTTNSNSNSNSNPNSNSSDICT